MEKFWKPRSWVVEQDKAFVKFVTIVDIAGIFLPREEIVSHLL